VSAGALRLSDEEMDFDYQPVLKGESLTLRPLLREDYDALFAVASDPAKSGTRSPTAARRLSFGDSSEMRWPEEGRLNLVSLNRRWR
jgi:hypothetical protein